MSIGLFDGQGYESVPFDFSDGQYHHVAMVTRGTTTEIVIDGTSVGEIGVGYGGATGQPFHVGSSDGEQDFLIGAVWALRVWNRALTKVAIGELSADAGPPDPSHAFCAQPRRVLRLHLGAQGRRARAGRW